MTAWSLLLVLALAGYVLGAIPFCLLIGKLYGVDIRRLGSGNVGGTNLRRGLKGKPLGSLMAFVGLMLDSGKGFVSALCLPMLLTALLGPPTPAVQQEIQQITAGVGAVLGHSFTIFLKFKGGKGVATGLGMFLVVCPQPALVGLAVFLLVYLISRITSLGSLVGAATVPIAAAVYFYWTSSIAEHAVTIALLVGTVVLVFIRHRSNIHRLMRGEELSFRESASGCSASSGATPNAAAETNNQQPVERSVH